METPDTWGISGPAFLVLYGIAFVLIAALGPITPDGVVATALFGSSVFWTVQPGLAASIGLPPPFTGGWSGIASTGVDSSSGGGGGDGGSGGGCGG